MENKEYSLVVIGGGAAGLMAAGSAAARGESVILLEKMEKTGRKVRITGKGRCNLTNVCDEETFMSKIQVNSDFFVPSFRAFDNRRTVKFFERLGVKLTVERGGRVFPSSGKAWDIAQSLVDWCRDEGVTVECESKVLKVLALSGKIYAVEYRNKRGFVRRIEAPNVILCTGGASYPATGSTGDGYRFADMLGHKIVEVRPSLVPLESSYPEMPFMKGLQLKNVKAALIVDNQMQAEEFGEMSFSERGIEGAVVLRMSRKAVDAIIDGKKVELHIDLKSALDEPTLTARIGRELEEQPADMTIGELLRKLVPRELVVPIAKAAGLIAKHPARELDAQRIDTLVKSLKNLVLPISDYRPFEEAVVTAGGVSTDDIYPETLESKKVKGLYFAGELIDLDANTGGYNLQIAFSTGYLASQLRKQK